MTLAGFFASNYPERPTGLKSRNALGRQDGGPHLPSFSLSFYSAFISYSFSFVMLRTMELADVGAFSHLPTPV
jgi:hypothetical protein